MTPKDTAQPPKKAAKRTPSILQQLQGVKESIANHYKLVFFLSIVTVLIYALITLNLTLAQQADETYRQEQQNATSPTKFDQKTIDRINSLNTVAPLEDNSPPPNPFAP